MQIRIGSFYDWPWSDRRLGPFLTELEEKHKLSFYSEDHARKGSGWSGGGDFRSKVNFVRRYPSDPIQIVRDGKRLYAGQYVADVPDSTILGEMESLESYGPEAYRAASPDKPEMDLGNALYELKDVPGMLKQAFGAVRPSSASWASRLHPAGLRLRNVSNFNLAVAFGWLPLLGDVRSFAASRDNLAKKLEQLKRDNGRPVRRKFPIKNLGYERTYPVASGQDPYGNMLHPNHVTQTYGGGSWDLSLVETSKVWFAGRFRFYLPEQKDLSNAQWDSLLRRRLYGLKPTPSRIYKAIPWTWLIDWFGNVGDNVANLNASVADRLINDYAFLMRHTERFHRLTVRQNIQTSYGEYEVVQAVTESGTSLKERVSASPFGFRFKQPELSPYQLTILGSLLGSRKR